MKVMITGASGLLGTAIVRNLPSKYEVIALSHNTTLPGTLKIDLMNPADLASIKSASWDIAIHCAAFRDPDVCEADPESTRRLNCEVSARIAEAAAQREAKMIQISTDYVFDGNNPPYSENDSTAPINFYGQSKLEAEQAVTSACPDSIILRIPVLYGDVPPPLASGFLENSIKALTTGKPVALDDKIVRYPTNTDDVAKVINFLLDIDFSGVIHASGTEKTTVYGWTMAVAKILGIDPYFASGLPDGQPRRAIRPLNAQLSTDFLKKLGGPVPRGYSEVLPCLDRLKAFKI